MHFNNLSEEEQQIANAFFKEVIPYFETIKEDLKFANFMDLFNSICNNREYNPNQLKLFNKKDLDKLKKKQLITLNS